MTNDQVINTFLKREPADTKSLHSDGVELKSYTLRIAKWDEVNSNILHVYSGGYRGNSHTTNSHRNHVRSNAQSVGIEIMEEENA